MKNLLLIASVSLLSAAAPSFAQAPMRMPTPASAPGDMAMPTTAMPYVAKAGAGDLYEIQSSQLALKQAKSAKVKKFAQMMIKHHMMTTKDVASAATAAGMTPPPPMLEPMQADMIAQLQPLQGAAFDTAYIAQQKTAHGMALSLHQTYAANGDTPQLKKAAMKVVPIVQQHIAALDRM